MEATATLDLPDYRMTDRRVITRRGVMWLGQTCNLRCHFCYFLDRIDNREHPEHPFMGIDKAKQICSTLVDTYGNNAIDIQGGEPTLYKHIFELVAYCRDIGLMPTLITNALALSNRKIARRLRDAGVRDLLVSIQGLDETYNSIVGVKDAFDRQMRGLDTVLESGIPVRFNCVLSKPALPQLERVAQLAVTSHARVVNFLAFNPFEDQQLGGKRSATNVPRYSEVSAHLNRALDILGDAGIEANVRYFPLCMVEPRHRKSIYNFQQLPYDIHEWDYASWSWTGQQPQRMKHGPVSPTVDLARETYASVSYTGPFKLVADGVRHMVQQYPAMRRPAATVHRTISRIAKPIRYDTRGNGQMTPLEQLYRENGRTRASQHCRYTYARSCSDCAARQICDGFHGDYAALFGSDEARPIKAEQPITDPRHFIREQRKVVEREDYPWAL